MTRGVDWWWASGDVDRQGLPPVAGAGDPRHWRGAITFPLPGLPDWNPNQPLHEMAFTAQGYDSWYDVDLRRRARQQFKALGYWAWAYGPIDQVGYHGSQPDTDFFDDPTQFLDRARELRADGITPALFLLDDRGRWAYEQGPVNREAIERDLTPLYSQPEWQELFPIVVAAWEPRWSAEDWQWVVRWMARVWARANRCVHFPSQMGAPAQHKDIEEHGYTEASAWNAILEFIHTYLMQETWVFGGDTAHGRTPRQQYVYDLLDRIKRFRYGSGSNAPTSGPEVDLWNSVQGDDPKPYNQWDGDLLTHCADPTRPLGVVSFEYASFYLKRPEEMDPAFALSEARAWGDIALQLPGHGTDGYGDNGPA